jgi:hypothetical protein
MTSNAQKYKKIGYVDKNIKKAWAIQIFFDHADDAGARRHC